MKPHMNKKKRRQRINYRIKVQQQKNVTSANNGIPEPQPPEMQGNLKNKTIGQENMTPNKNTCLNDAETEPLSLCRKLGVLYDYPNKNETKYEQNKGKRRINSRIKVQKQKLQLSDTDIPLPPPSSGDIIVDNALDCIRAFELKQMSYKINRTGV